MSKHIIIGQSTNINVFSWLLFFFKLRERESGIQNLGIKEKCPQSYLSYFTTGFHWRIFLLSRANRLCSIFFTLAWRTWGPSCLRNSFVFNPEYWLWFVCPLRTLLKNWLSYYLLPLRGPSQSFGFSLLPLGVWRPEVTKYQHLLMPLCDLHSSLTVTFFDG